MAKLRCSTCKTQLRQVPEEFIPSSGHGWAACKSCGAMLLGCPNDPGDSVDGLVGEIGRMLEEAWDLQPAVSLVHRLTVQAVADCYAVGGAVVAFVQRMSGG